jgi:hypothetical protein
MPATVHASAHPNRKPTKSVHAKSSNPPYALHQVSMLTEATGPYILVGDDRPEKPSHIFVDGLVDKECPFLFNAGSNDGKT